MSASGRVVTHIRRSGSCEPIRFSKSDKTALRGDDKAEVLKHSSKASTIR
jgi:hypothetical protein